LTPADGEESGDVRDDVGAALTTAGIFTSPAQKGFILQLAIWLWFMCSSPISPNGGEGRGKAQATRCAKRARILSPAASAWSRRKSPAPELQKGDLVVCEAGDVIPADGDVVEGIASVDESAITGESAPVIRESGGDRSAVTGGQVSATGL